MEDDSDMLYEYLFLLHSLEGIIAHDMAILRFAFKLQRQDGLSTRLCKHIHTTVKKNKYMLMWTVSMDSGISQKTKPKDLQDGRRFIAKAKENVFNFHIKLRERN